MTNDSKYDAEDFLLNRIGPECSRLYKATIAIDPFSITLTGANVTKVLRVPWMHRVISLDIFQTTSAHAADASALQVTFKRPQGKHFPPYFEEILFRDLAVVPTAGFMAEQFGETFERENSSYSLILNGTNTNIAEVVIYVQKCEP